MLQDIAVITGGQVIYDETGLVLEKASLEELGSVRKIIIDKENTMLIGGNGRLEAIQARIQQIRQQIDNASTDDDKEKLQERLAKLSSGVAVLGVGAATEIAMKEKKDRIEDACNACDARGRRRRRRAATEIAMKEKKDHVEDACDVCDARGRRRRRRAGRGAGACDASSSGQEPHKGDNPDQDIGIKIVLRAMEQPLREIMTNTGLEPSVVLNAVKESKGNHGLNAQTDE